MEPGVYTPVSAAANLRRSSVVAIVIAAVAIVVLSTQGHPLMGVFGAVGLALGAINNRMLQMSVLKFADATMTKRRFRNNVFMRLGIITVLAIGIGLIIRPDGLGVFAGLAVFQVLMLVGAAVPVFRSLRPTS